jgi:hypothetical protein
MRDKQYQTRHSGVCSVKLHHFLAQQRILQRWNRFSEVRTLTLAARLVTELAACTDKVSSVLRSGSRFQFSAKPLSR